MKAIEGVAELLERLDAPYCVASNSSPERMRVSLKASRLLPFFEGRMFSAAAVAQPKPAPDLFLHAPRCMNAAPSRCGCRNDGVGVRGRHAGQGEELRAAGAIPFDAMASVPALLAR